MGQLTPPVGDRDHVAGPPGAPLTLVEYGDFECPHCGMAYPILKVVQRRLGDRLRFVYRYFPLKEIHPHARHAAEAAEAAGVQGRFWEMHAILFENQHALTDDDLMSYANRLRLDIPRFVEHLTSGAAAQKVREDFRSGVRSGVNGTPTFFVNGERYEGVWADQGAFIRYLERAALAGAV